ncbi:1-(5-phosphoribosyl)-5-((5-phosphoribosylamino)methylideneamino)imidazole-4-carboxamideisomerase [Lentibacillus sp. JNUCC-1]|uniref:1-(5-phosphoribosyl)-5-[(5- phosphoribosylamino)methylideneamino]imidazole-4- carboxamide isomerase n=1 Tax=Lentibacillus sp. JNUCC-1 TaxID=2654513 RepID=UPI0012E6F189|nr:1-(5-phosphoribosyl)-5-[(5-phosphoribosylamino)methylideneamino]imidazole-4-carboxamide isomerase [Lentibacillus sp. JNUCC-1]MUV38618.1 1-(5-phosphoribosyl)-5-((5-phosphoribosylamino)methylideneamino)imidazole-4-carboxamideisomerase [Lentibacillus sp. JNUCC-1]
MILFPAIDIRNGKCVRLIQGDYNQERIYSDSPVEMAKTWERENAAYLHIVDLDGAKNAQAVNENLITDIAKQISIPIQVGGGIRTQAQINAYINAGVDRVILGTAALQDDHLLKTAGDRYGARIAVSIDARNGYMATEGWTETSDVRALDFVKKLRDLGVQTVIYTDISKDGMLEGPNLTELEAIQSTVDVDIIASGGVTTEDDIRALRQMGLYGAIVGRALYDGTTTLKKLLEV